MCSVLNYTSALQEIAKHEGIQDAKILTQGKSENGDGYLGELKILEIVSPGPGKSLHLVLKIAPSNKKLREQGFIDVAYINEINFYTRINPAFQKFQEKRNVTDGFKAVAKCYKTSTEELKEFLILENLREQGFSMWDRKVPMNREHVIAVFKEYAKFHATSYALKDQEEVVFQEMASLANDIFGQFIDEPERLKSFNNIFDKTTLHVKEAFGEGELLEAFRNFNNDWYENFKETRSKNQDIYAILHGDCWCNNLMFTYEDSTSTTSPKSMKIIDWQLIKMGPPVLDLSHFLYTCGSKELFDDLDSLLEIYHEALCKHLHALGSDGAKILPFARLKELWKNYGRYGLIMSFLALKITISDSDEAPDITKAAEENNEIISAFDFKSKNDDEYYRRLDDIIMHCFERKFI